MSRQKESQLTGDTQMTRRDVLKWGFRGALGLTILPAVLEACSNASATAAATAPATAPATAAAVDTLAATAAATQNPDALPSTMFKEGLQIAPGIELPSVISSDMTRAFVSGVTVNGNSIPQYQDSELFLGLYNAAQAEKGNWGPWAPIAIQNVSGAAHLKTEGDVGLFDLVADQKGSIALYFMQLGKHQHETAVNGNGESNPDWRNQYTIHLTPYQAVWPIDRNGNQILWEDGVTPMTLDAGPKGDFAIEVFQTAIDQDAIFGVLLNVDPSVSGIQATAIKVQRGPDDNPGKTGENKIDSNGIAACTIPAIPEQ